MDQAPERDTAGDRPNFEEWCQVAGVPPTPSARRLVRLVAEHCAGICDRDEDAAGAGALAAKIRYAFQQL